MNNSPTYSDSAAIVVNAALGPDTARPLPSAATVVVLRDDASLAAAIAAIREADPTLPLAACPVMLWQRDQQVLVGPGAALDVTQFVPDNPSLDVRIHSDSAQRARVVISWLDGPTREIVAQRLAALPDTGLSVELVQECLGVLAFDVVAAVFDIAAAHPLPAYHPVLDRVRAVRDGRDIYFDLLDVTKTLLHELRRYDVGLYIDALSILRELDNQDAADAVLQDVDGGGFDSEFLPVRATDEHAALVALFNLASATARRLGPARLESAREQFVLGG